MELTLGVTLAVLGAGLLHASWNALLKSAGGGDPLLDTATVVAGSTVCSIVALPFVPIPLAASWPFALASVVIHFGYYLTLAQAYRTGDLSFAYPLMRGTAPLLVTVLGILFLRELPTRAGVARHRRSSAPASSRSRSRSAITIRAPPSSGRSPTRRSSPCTRWSTAPARARPATRWPTCCG